MKIHPQVNKVFKNLDDYTPSDPNCYDKIKGELKIGKRFYWYYNDDLIFFSDEGEKIKDHINDIYSGIIVPIPDVINNRGELDFYEVIVVMDNYPIEMDYPEVTWVCLSELLDDVSLVGFFDLENIKN